MEAVRVFRRTTGEFKPKSFFQGSLLKEAALGGAVITNHKPDITRTLKTKEILPDKEGPSKRQPPEGGDNKLYCKPPKRGHCFCSGVYTSCRKFNYTKQCTRTPIATALQWARQNLVPPMPLDNSCSIGWLCLAVANCTSVPWVLNTIQGYKIDFWVQPEQSHPPRPLHFSQKETILLHPEIHKLLGKQSISVVTQPIFSSHLQQ